MPITWGVDMSQRATDQLKLHCALTPALEARGWRDLDSAPKDGTEVELRIVHINAAYDEPTQAESAGWIGHCFGKWIDHNGGGWTWDGLCGAVCQWRPR